MRMVIWETPGGLKVRIQREGRSFKALTRELEKITPAFGNALLVSSDFGADFLELMPDESVKIAIPQGSTDFGMSFKERLVARLLEQGHEIYEPHDDEKLGWAWEPRALEAELC